MNYLPFGMPGVPTPSCPAWAGAGVQRLAWEEEEEREEEVEGEEEEEKSKEEEEE